MANRYRRRELTRIQPPKWEPKKPGNQKNQKTIYSIRNGKILGIPIENIQSIKKSVSDVSRGKIYTISMPDSLANKYIEPQTRLWYYDKRNYQIDPRPLSADPEDYQKPTIKFYKPMLEETPKVMDDAFTKTSTSMPEPVEQVEPQPQPQPAPPPSTLPSNLDTSTQNESLPAITQRILTPNKIGQASFSDQVPHLPPIIPSSPSNKSLYTLQSINKSIRKYRF